MAGVFSKVFLHVSIEKRSNHKRREIMMENNELLQAISNMMDQKLDPVKNEIQDMKGEIQTIKGEVQTMKGEIQTIKGEVQTMKGEIQTIKGEVQTMKGEIQDMKGEIQDMKGEIQDMKGEIQTIKEDQAAMKSELQMQIKRTEQNLRTEIRESENLILQEVSRVHHILNDHIGNQNVHTA